MKRLIKALGAVAIIAATASAQAQTMSSYRHNLDGGQAVYIMVEGYPEIQECPRKLGSAVRVYIKPDHKEAFLYGRGCWSAGLDGFITFHVKPLDNNRVGSVRVHHSEVTKN